jgi:nitronate monooxygenase
MQRTSFQVLTGIEHPIIQGPFGGGLSTVELTSLVSNRGGLGSFGAYLMQGDEIAALTRTLRASTAKPFAVNLWVSDHDPGGREISEEAFARAWSIVEPFYREYGIERPARPTAFHPGFEKQVEALLEARPPVFSFVFGIPSAAILRECRRRGILTVGTATTLAEGLALDQAGVDVILATGLEAGGHRPSFLRSAEDSLIGTMPLIRQIASRVRRPVIAAGGIADGDGVRSILALGASAAQLGTAFLACKESGTIDAHRDILFSERAHNTVLTRAYSGRLARGITNKWIAEFDRLCLAPFPIHAWFMSRLKTASMAAGKEDFMSLYAGQGTPLLKHRSAAALMGDLIDRLQ